MDNMHKVQQSFHSVHGGHGGGGHHGGHGGGGGRRGWGGWGGGYWGYPYPYWDYPQEVVVLADDATKAKPKEEPKKEEPITTKSSAKEASSMNYIIGGAVGAVAGYFIGKSSIGGAVIGAGVVIGSMVAINKSSNK